MIVLLLLFLVDKVWELESGRGLWGGLHVEFIDIEKNRIALDELMRWEFQENRTLESRPGIETKWVECGLSREFIIVRMKGAARGKNRNMEIFREWYKICLNALRCTTRLT